MIEIFYSLVLFTFLITKLVHNITVYAEKMPNEILRLAEIY